MTQVKISELKVGDRLADGYKGEYGQFINFIVSSIAIAKGGRYVIKVNRTFVYNDGSTLDQLNIKYSNGPLSGETLAELF